MTISPRVAQLRQQSLDAKASLSPERARLLTEYYRSLQALESIPLQRAGAFAYLLAHETLYLGEGELIVGEKGETPKAAPTYPELCCHSLSDLETLDSRPKIPFAAGEEIRELYRETVIPFWQGRTLRERLFAEMTPEWQACYEAGIFTEFMEQRAPGHTVLDDKIYHKGMLDFIADIDASLATARLFQ